MSTTAIARTERKIIRTRGRDWCQLELSYDGTRLSICGVEGGRHGERFYCTDGKRRNAYAFGQITETIARYFPEVARLLPWHLNDMRAGCVHQRADGWGKDRISEPCPTCGYKYGTAWLTEPLPSDVAAYVADILERGEAALTR